MSAKHYQAQISMEKQFEFEGPGWGTYNARKKMPATPAIPRQSPIEVLGRPNAA